MHDIDRTTLEATERNGYDEEFEDGYAGDYDEFEYGDEYDAYADEMEFEADYDDMEFEADLDDAIRNGMRYDDEFEYGMRYDMEYGDEYDAYADEEYGDPYGEIYDDEYEFESGYGDYEMEYSVPGPFDEQTEMELAAELLTVADDQEMEQFLGAIASALAPAAIGAARKLLPKAARAGAKLAKGLFGRKRRSSRRRRPSRYRRSTPRRRSTRTRTRTGIRTRHRSSRPRYCRCRPRGFRPRRRPRGIRFPKINLPSADRIRDLGRRFSDSDTGQALGRGLRYTGKQVLPALGGDIGRSIAGSRGRTYGRKFGSLASDAFGLELEGLSPEDQELEVARRFVRLAGDATREAMEAPKLLPPKTVAKQALKKAAKKHAPGLAKKMNPDEEL